MSKFKFKLGQTVYWLSENKVCSADILSRVLVENKTERVANEEQRSFYHKFGPSGVAYNVHGSTMKEDEIFGSRRELVENLLGVELQEFFAAEEKPTND